MPRRFYILAGAISRYSWCSFSSRPKSRPQVFVRKKGFSSKRSENESTIALLTYTRKISKSSHSSFERGGFLRRMEGICWLHFRFPPFYPPPLFVRVARARRNSCIYITKRLIDFDMWIQFVYISSLRLRIIRTSSQEYSAKEASEGNHICAEWYFIAVWLIKRYECPSVLIGK